MERSHWVESDTLYLLKSLVDYYCLLHHCYSMIIFFKRRFKVPIQWNSDIYQSIMLLNVEKNDTYIIHVLFIIKTVSRTIYWRLMF